MPNFTLILITDSLLARVDVHVRSEVTIDSFEMMALPEGETTNSIIQSALALGPKRTNPVWLFSNRFWTGTVSIPSDLHAIANGDELNQAAILDAETQSGLPAFESKVVMTRIKNDAHGDPQYWVTQALDSELSAIDQGFRDAKAKWAGIAHVALECPTTQLSSTNPHRYSLESKSEILDWAKDAAKILPLKITTSPFFASPVKAMSPKTQVLVASVLLSLTVLICLSVTIRDRMALQSIEQLSANALKQNESSEALNRKLQKAELSLEESRKKRQEEQSRVDAISTEFELVRHNQALLLGHCANLIDAIGDSANSDSWLQSIESNGTTTTLKGLSLNEVSAHRFASGLEQQPSLRGHIISPAQITPLETELIQFSIVVDLEMASASLLRSQELSQ